MERAVRFGGFTNKTIQVHVPDAQFVQRNIRARTEERTVPDNVPMSPKEKLAKLLPAETVAAYALLDPLIRQAWSDPNVAWHRTALEIGLWVALAFVVVVGYWYLYKFWAVRSQIQQAFYAVALIAYVAALGGPFALYDWFQPIYGSILAAVVSILIAFVPSTRKADERDDFIEG